MATGKIRSRSSGFDLHVEVHGVEQASREFREIRRELARELTGLEAQVAERTVLPDARRRAAGLKVDGIPVATTLVVRKRRSAPYLTTTLRGKRGRAVGLQEFGGVVRTVIRPRSKKALLVNGQPVAIVRTARHYRAGLFLQHAASSRIDTFGAEVRDEIVDRFFRPRFPID